METIISVALDYAQDVLKYEEELLNPSMDIFTYLIHRYGDIEMTEKETDEIYHLAMGYAIREWEHETEEVFG